MEKLLTPDDVAEILQVCRRTAYTIMHQMPHLEKPFRVSEAGLRAWLNEKTAQPEAEKATARKGKAKAVSRMRDMPLMGHDFHIPRRRAQ